MSTFNKVMKESLDNIPINAGMILKSFNPLAPAAPTKDTVVCATTGGIQANCVPTFEDFGSDIDNCPNNTKEMKRITGWDCTFGFTALELSEYTIMLALGASAKVNSEIQAKAEVLSTHFKDIWFVSERVDDKIIAIKLENALSSGGFSYKTQKNGKGQLTVTLTGHISIENSDNVPMIFYLCSESSSTPSSQSDDE